MGKSSKYAEAYRERAGHSRPATKPESAPSDADLERMTAPAPAAVAAVAAPATKPEPTPKRK